MPNIGNCSSIRPRTSSGCGDLSVAGENCSRKQRPSSSIASMLKGFTGGTSSSRKLPIVFAQYVDQFLEITARNIPFFDPAREREGEILILRRRIAKIELDGACLGRRSE